MHFFVQFQSGVAKSSVALSPTWLTFLAAVHKDILQRDSQRWHEKKKKRVNERVRDGIGIKVHALSVMKLQLCVYVCVSCPGKQSTLAEEDRC